MIFFGNIQTVMENWEVRVCQKPSMNVPGTLSQED